jgi:hypothetical protein
VDDIEEEDVEEPEDAEEEPEVLVRAKGHKLSPNKEALRIMMGELQAGNDNPSLIQDIQKRARAMVRAKKPELTQAEFMDVIGTLEEFESR